jgi:hypothetical protein
MTVANFVGRSMRRLLVVMTVMIPSGAGEEEPHFGLQKA